MLEIDVLFLIIIGGPKCTFLAPRFHLVLIYSLSIFYMYCKIGLKYLSKGPKFLGPLNTNPKKRSIDWCVILKYYYIISTIKIIIIIIIIIINIII